MAYQQLLASQTAAADSTTLSNDGTKHITLGIFCTQPWTERAGCMVYQVNGTDPVMPLYDPRGRPVVLTAHSPTVVIYGAGTYLVRKSATTQAVGVWGDDGT
jgi:hypothetical protein